MVQCVCVRAYEVLLGKKGLLLAGGAARHALWFAKRDWVCQNELCSLVLNKLMSSATTNIT